jgi:hypothetical protein
MAGYPPIKLVIILKYRLIKAALEAFVNPMG